MKNWNEKKAKLEKEKLEMLKIISDYEGNLRPFRKVTESEYQLAKRRLWQIASEIAEGEHEANKPLNPLDDMTKEQLQAKYDRLKSELMTDDPTQGRLGQTIDRDKLAEFNAVGNRLNELKIKGND